jgi:hypothetical protein
VTRLVGILEQHELLHCNKRIFPCKDAIGRRIILLWTHLNINKIKPSSSRRFFSEAGRPICAYIAENIAETETITEATSLIMTLLLSLPKEMSAQYYLKTN